MDIGVGTTEGKKKKREEAVTRNKNSDKRQLTYLKL